jgi:hypothetical protein
VGRRHADLRQKLQPARTGARQNEGCAVMVRQGWMRRHVT